MRQILVAVIGDLCLGFTRLAAVPFIHLFVIIAEIIEWFPECFAYQSIALCAEKVTSVRVLFELFRNLI